MLPHRVAPSLLPLLTVVLVACGREEQRPAPATQSTSPADLAAVGYAGWDDNADDELAGVTRHDPDHAWPGWNLVSDTRSTCWALDMDGRPVHTWTVPGHDQVERFLLLEEGRIVVLSLYQGVTLLDRDSRVVWQISLAAHHDLAALPDGGFLVAAQTERALAGRRVRFDQLVRLDADGGIVDTWDTWEHREELDLLHPPTLLDRPAADGAEQKTVYDYYHLNTIQVLGPSELGRLDSRFAAGQVLLCLRNTNLLLILDGTSREVLWSWGPGELDFPHSPVLTSGGGLLVFDNGRHRGNSRVLEIDPRDGSTLWSWEADPPEDFFSETRGACQRLPNGNTLITESARGHVFEVTPRGEIVWEYWNPELVGNRRRRIYSVERVAIERLPEELRSR